MAAIGVGRAPPSRQARRIGGIFLFFCLNCIFSIGCDKSHSPVFASDGAIKAEHQKNREGKCEPCPLAGQECVRGCCCPIAIAAKTLLHPYRHKTGIGQNLLYSPLASLLCRCPARWSETIAMLLAIRTCTRMLQERTVPVNWGGPCLSRSKRSVRTPC